MTIVGRCLMQWESNIKSFSDLYYPVHIDYDLVKYQHSSFERIVRTLIYTSPCSMDRIRTLVPIIPNPSNLSLYLQVHRHKFSFFSRYFICRLMTSCSIFTSSYYLFSYFFNFFLQIHLIPGIRSPFIRLRCIRAKLLSLI